MFKLRRYSAKLLWPTSAPQISENQIPAFDNRNLVCGAHVGHNNFPEYLHNLNRWQISGYSQISSNFLRNGEFGNLLLALRIPVISFAGSSLKLVHAATALQHSPSGREERILSGLLGNISFPGSHLAVPGSHAHEKNSFLVLGIKHPELSQRTL